MEKNIFDKQFVYFMWDYSLKDKRCFVADSIDMLQHYVETYNDKYKFKYVVKKDSAIGAFPFCAYIAKGTPAHYRFAYYDPLYDIKWAWKQGKRIQCRCHSGAWLDASTPDWDNKALEFRVKPVSAYRPFKSTQELKSTFLALTNQTAIPANFEPVIWVRSKYNTSSTFMITHFCENLGVVHLCGYLNIGIEQLFTDYTFLDGTPCGVKEE